LTIRKCREAHPLQERYESEQRDTAMRDEYMKHLSNRGTPDWKGNPLSLYSFLLVCLLFSILPLLLITRLLPASLNAPTERAVALLVGVELAGAILLALVAAWLKSRKWGAIISALALLIWVAWMFLMPKQPSVGPFGTAAILLVLLIPTPLVFIGGLYIIAGFLLPTDEKGHRCKVFLLLLDCILGQNFPCYVVVDERREEDKIVERVEGNLFAEFPFGPGAIITDCDHAVAVSDGVKFKGAQGPGVIFTGFGDRPVRTFDLRPQLRAFQVPGLTKDGIRVKVLAFAPHQLDPGGQKPQLGSPFPYRKSAAFTAFHAQSVENPGKEEGKKQRTWDELAEPLGKRVLQDILSRYRFDELYGPLDLDGEIPRLRIAADFRSRLREKLRPLGIYLVGGGISNIMPDDDDVLRQRVRSWQAEWTRRVMLQQAKGHAERLRRIERARAEARADLILTLGERLAELDRPGVGVTPEMIVPHFLRILEELASRPTLRRYLPRELTQGARVRLLREPPERKEEG